MKLIIAGSRHAPYSVYPAIAHAVDLFESLTKQRITEGVCGLARGMDLYGKKYLYLERKVPVKDFPADWNQYGKGAGPIRNAQMRDYADGLVAFIWDGSRGTANMIKLMLEANKPTLAIFEGQLNKWAFGTNIDQFIWHGVDE